MHVCCSRNFGRAPWARGRPESQRSPSESDARSPNRVPQHARGPGGMTLSFPLQRLRSEKFTSANRDNRQPFGPSQETQMPAWQSLASRGQSLERRGGDSNPRNRFTPFTGLANRRIRPLCHLSKNDFARADRLLPTALRRLCPTGQNAARRLSKPVALRKTPIFVGFCEAEKINV